MESSYVRKLKVIPTFDGDHLNGCVLPVVNIHEENTPPIEQVYITRCDTHEKKGPHMHTGEKEDRFYCIQGHVVVVCRNEETQEITEYVLDALDDQLLIIPPYNSHALVALYANPASVLSMPNEGYKEDEEYNQIETQYEGYDWTKWL